MPQVRQVFVNYVWLITGMRVTPCKTPMKLFSYF